jgi:hypothetical protein
MLVVPVKLRNAGMGVSRGHGNAHFGRARRVFACEFLRILQRAIQQNQATELISTSVNLKVGG